MDKIYYTPSNSGSFGGVQRLKQKHKSPLVEKWLTFQDTYTLHKPVRKTFKRRRVLVGGIDDQWQIDLVDLSSLSRENNKFRFLLTCIDVLSKYAWVVPLKDKSAQSVVVAMENILTDSNRTPNAIQGDKGKEFVNRKFNSMLKKYNIHFFSTENDDIKASIVERFNRTLKSRMWRYFTYTRKKRYIDKLQNFVQSYNHSIHRTIKMAPADVTKDDELLLLTNMYTIASPKSNRSLKIGDSVRIVMTRRPFKKGYTAQWSEEIFKVIEKVKSSPITYRLQDLMNEEIDGTFYIQELQPIGIEEDKAYILEDVLKTRKRGSIVEHFVKWRGYPSKFNSWVLKEDVME